MSKTWKFIECNVVLLTLLTVIALTEDEFYLLSSGEFLISHEMSVSFFRVLKWVYEMATSKSFCRLLVPCQYACRYKFSVDKFIPN